MLGTVNHQPSQHHDSRKRLQHYEGLTAGRRNTGQGVAHGVQCEQNRQYIHSRDDGRVNEWAGKDDHWHEPHGSNSSFNVLGSGEAGLVATISVMSSAAAKG